MPETKHNYLAILLAAVVQFVFGAITGAWRRKA